MGGCRGLMSVSWAHLTKKTINLELELGCYNILFLVSSEPVEYPCATIIYAVTNFIMIDQDVCVILSLHHIV